LIQLGGIKVARLWLHFDQRSKSIDAPAAPSDNRRRGRDRRMMQTAIGGAMAPGALWGGY
jgi:hypothetical protein